jgi:hypothetical protein
MQDFAVLTPAKRQVGYGTMNAINSMRLTWLATATLMN